MGGMGSRDAAVSGRRRRGGGGRGCRSSARGSFPISSSRSLVGSGDLRAIFPPAAPRSIRGVEKARDRASRHTISARSYDDERGTCRVTAATIGTGTTGGTGTGARRDVPLVVRLARHLARENRRPLTAPDPIRRLTPHPPSPPPPPGTAAATTAATTAAMTAATTATAATEAEAATGATTDTIDAGGARRPATSARHAARTPRPPPGELTPRVAPVPDPSHLPLSPPPPKYIQPFAFPHPPAPP